jgi:hypothetical protein
MAAGCKDATQATTATSVAASMERFMGISFIAKAIISSRISSRLFYHKHHAQESRGASHDFVMT